MFFLFPLSHENASVRKWPLFAMLIVALNVILLAFTMLTSGPARERVGATQLAAQTYADAHPEAATKAPRGCVTKGAPTGEVPTGLLDEMGIPLPKPAEDADASATLAKLCADVFDARDATIERRFGYVPERGLGFGLLTHQFLHAGILHLVFNMWFFWLCGCNLEDRWGKLIFGAFYLMGGAVGGFVFGKLSPDQSIPLIGASGAVASAMGGFLAILGGTRIRFAYVLWVTFKPRYGTFEATAYWMLPLWLMSELVQALLFPEDGTAHWAHVGGFAFGLVVGLVMRFSGIDAKLDARAEEEGTVRQDPRILAAAALTDEGKLEAAIASLEELLQGTPDNVDALVELLRAVTATRDLARRLSVAQRLMQSYLGRGFVDAAVDVYQELRHQQLEQQMPRADLSRLGDAFARRQRNDIALLAYRTARRDGLVDAEGAKIAAAEAVVLGRMGRHADARTLFAECQASPFLAPEVEQRVQAQLADLERGPSAG